MTITDNEALSALASDTGELRAENQNYSQTITLREAIEVSGELRKELHLSEPNVYQMVEASKVISTSPTGADLRAYHLNLIHRVTGWPMTALEQLPVSQQREACEFMAQIEDENRRKAGDGTRDDEEFVLMMPSPIEAVGRKFSLLNLHEPVGLHRTLYERRCGRSPTVTKMYQAEVSLVSAVGDWPEAAVLKMPVGLFSQAADYLIGFF